MNKYETFTAEELRGLLRQRDRQLEGERKGSKRTLAEVARLREALDEISDASSGDFDSIRLTARKALEEA